MGHGAVPLVFGAGGQTEVVRDGVDGRFWERPEDLAALTAALAADAGERRRLGRAARESAGRWARPAFARRLAETLDPVLPCAS